MSNTFVVGTEIQLTTTPTSGAEAGGAVLHLLKPDGTTTAVTAEWQSEGHWAINVIVDQVGEWAYTWEVDEPDFLDNGKMVVVARYDQAVQPPDLTDLRVLIPRTRRALLGPERSNHDALDDVDVLAAIADAVAAVILVAPNAFGHSLIVADRDPIYGAPNAWKTAEAMGLEAQTVVVTQAALDYWSHELRTLKTQETIKDEAVEWSYSISAQALRDHLAFLRTERDRAISALTTSQPALDQYASFLAVRDVRTSRLIEPWVDGVSVGGLETDPRFF